MRNFCCYPETKDSGTCLRQAERGRQAEWLGHLPVHGTQARIPAHWNVKKLKHLATLQTGGTPIGVKESAFDEADGLWVKPDDLCADHGISSPRMCWRLACTRQPRSLGRFRIHCHWSERGDLA